MNAYYSINIIGFLSIINGRDNQRGRIEGSPTQLYNLLWLINGLLLFLLHNAIKSGKAQILQVGQTYRMV